MALKQYVHFAVLSAWRVLSPSLLENIPLHSLLVMHFVLKCEHTRALVICLFVSRSILFNTQHTQG